MANNIVIRKCSRCGKEKNQEHFTYLGDGVWGCECGSMFTTIKEVIDPDKK